MIDIFEGGRARNKGRLQTLIAIAQKLLQTYTGYF
jgi:hypothetical protein